MSDALRARYPAEVSHQFRRLKALADKALGQASEEDFFVTLDPESNSLVVLLKHMAGNMRSRWTDFLASDGEKPDRHRDGEFITTAADTRAGLLEEWERGWDCLFTALGSLSAEDLDRTVYIRNEPHSVTDAIGRQLVHYASHVGQIVFLVKHLKSQSWQTLSIPRGRSEEHLAAMRENWPADKSTGPS